VTRPLLLALLTLISAPSLHADELPIVNAGFEAQAILPGTFIVGLPAGWTAWDPFNRLDGNADALGLIDPTGTSFFSAPTPEGQRAALVFLAGPEGGEAGLQQTLAATLQADTRYALTVAVGNIASGTSLPGSSDGGGLFYNLNGFPGYRIELRAGDVLIAVDDSTLSIPEGEWRDSLLTVDIGAAHPALGQALQIRLVNLALPGTAQAPGIEVDFDHVRLQALPVPEPATALLWALGGVAGWAWRRRLGRGADTPT